MPMVTPDELREYIKIMKESGLVHMKCGELELYMGPAAPTMSDRTSVKDDYNQLLFAATEGIAPDDEFEDS
jgi:hypothetical protein